MKKAMAALLISLFGISGSICLKGFSFISEASFVIFILTSVLVGLFIAYSDKVRSVNLKEGEIILQEMKEAESSVKELGRAVLDVTEASSHTLMLESFDSDAYDKAIARLRELVA